MLRFAPHALRICRFPMACLAALRMPYPAFFYRTPAAHRYNRQWTNPRTILLSRVFPVRIAPSREGRRFATDPGSAFTSTAVASTPASIETPREPPIAVPVPGAVAQSPSASVAKAPTRDSFRPHSSGIHHQDTKSVGAKPEDRRANRGADGSLCFFDTRS